MQVNWLCVCVKQPMRTPAHSTWLKSRQFKRVLLYKLVHGFRVLSSIKLIRGSVCKQSQGLGWVGSRKAS